jgi:hypothetical protein
MNVLCKNVRNLTPNAPIKAHTEIDQLGETLLYIRQ